jgi:hypothetical protein
VARSIVVLVERCDSRQATARSWISSTLTTNWYLVPACGCSTNMPRRSASTRSGSG